MKEKESQPNYASSHSGTKNDNYKNNEIGITPLKTKLTEGNLSPNRSIISFGPLRFLFQYKIVQGKAGNPTDKEKQD